jgi:elongator complex protein 3
MKTQLDYTLYTDLLVTLFKELELLSDSDIKGLAKWLKKAILPDGTLLSKDQLIQAYKELAGHHGLAPFTDRVVRRLRMKPVRTLSGVTPVTVLTKPFPCPGKCIFCPSDVRMPKSYLSDEPGAQRAERNWFDPYLQTYNRLQALSNIGHSVEKIELIILGGTWSYYPEVYQVWFIKECFRALNDFGVVDAQPEITEKYETMSRQLTQMQFYAPTADPITNQNNLKTSQINGEQISQTYNQVISELYVKPEKLGGFDQYQSAHWQELKDEQLENETAKSRCTGLVIETRPDCIDEAEVLRIRKLGCTKVQLGFQSLDEQVLALNKRGHGVLEIRQAVKLLRSAGFKIHAHWMANLYGSSVKKDKADYLKLFADPDFRPDELKIYPCSLIQSAELMQYFKSGKWQPYSHQELLDIVSFCLENTPPYCRLTRVIRDIPSPDIVTGNKTTNFRQLAENSLSDQGKQSQDIRAREIRNTKFESTQTKIEEISYQTSVGQDFFIQATLADQKIIGFLRLSLPNIASSIDEINNEAVIREIHVYGQAQDIGKTEQNKAQHFGFGTLLIERAKQLAAEAGYNKMAVISAIGTREYYRKKGFVDGELYQHLNIS